MQNVFTSSWSVARWETVMGWAPGHWVRSSLIGFKALKDGDSQGSRHLPFTAVRYQSSSSISTLPAVLEAQVLLAEQKAAVHCLSRNSTLVSRSVSEPLLGFIFQAKFLTPFPSYFPMFGESLIFNRFWVYLLASWTRLMLKLGCKRPFRGLLSFFWEYSLRDSPK